MCFLSSRPRPHISIPPAGLKNEQDSTQAPAPKLDLAFKEGQTIKIQIKKKDAGDDADNNPSKARSAKGRTMVQNDQE